MKKVLIAIMLVGMILTGCENASVEEVQSQIENAAQKKKDELVDNAQKEAKNAVLEQIETFFSDPELSGKLGISDEKKEEMRQKLEETVENYDLDASGIEGFQKQMNDVLEKELDKSDQNDQKSNSTENDNKDSVDQLKEEVQSAVTQFIGK